MQEIPYEVADPIKSGDVGGQIEAPEAGNKFLGDALNNMSNVLQQGADTIDRYNKAHQEQTIQNIYNSFNYTPTFLQNKQNAPLGAAGFAKQTVDDYNNKVNQYVSNIEDPYVRKQVNEKLMAGGKQYADEGMAFELHSTETAQNISTNNSLNSIINDSLSDPTNEEAFNAAIQKGHALIDASPGISADNKAIMKQSFMNHISDTVGQELANVNTTPEGYAQNLEALTKRRAYMTPVAYNASATTITNKRTAAQGQLATQAVPYAKNYLEMTQKGETPSADYLEAMKTIPGYNNANVQSMIALANNNIQNTNNFKAMPISAQRASLEKSKNELATGNYSSATNGFVSNPSMVSKLPPALHNTVTSVANDLGMDAVSLESVLHKESSGDIAKGNWAGRNPTSSAGGIGQFLTSTALDTVNKHPDFIGAHMQPPVSGDVIRAMTNQQKINLRDDPHACIAMTGIYDHETQAYVAQQAGVPVSSVPLYLCHQAGPEAATKIMIGARDNPDAPVSTIVSNDVIKNNGTYYQQHLGGNKWAVKSNKDVLAGFQGDNAINVANSKRAEVQRYSSILTPAYNAYNKDAIQFGKDKGVVTDFDFNDPNAIAKRIQDISNLKSYMGTNQDLDGKELNEPKVLSTDEATKVRNTLNNPAIPTDTKVSIISNLQLQKKGNESPQEYASQQQLNAQIGDSNPIHTLIGGMLRNEYRNPKARMIASDMMKGDDRINENPSLTSSLQLIPTNINEAVTDTFGNTLNNLSPLNQTNHGTRDTIIKGANALYVQRHTEGDSGSFNKDLYKQCLVDASGNAAIPTKPNTVVGNNIDGSKVLLPKGVDEDGMHSYLHHATLSDLVRDSETKSLPQIENYDGSLTALSLSNLNSVTLKYDHGAAGDNTYYTMLLDGKPVVTANRDKYGNHMPYMLGINKDNVKRVNDAGTSNESDTFAAMPMKDKAKYVENVGANTVNKVYNIVRDPSKVKNTLNDIKNAIFNW